MTVASVRVVGDTDGDGPMEGGPWNVDVGDSCQVSWKNGWMRMDRVANLTVKFSSSFPMRQPTSIPLEPVGVTTIETRDEAGRWITIWTIILPPESAEAREAADLALAGAP